MVSYELLEYVTGVLLSAGLRAGEGYPGLQRPEVDQPMAAVGLRELDVPAGMARFQIRVLSPRILGGWCCQVWAARAAEALCGARMVCAAQQMEYLSGSDCFCVELEASVEVVSGPEGWVTGRRWRIFCGAVELTGVESFCAVRDRQRRLVGAHWESSPVAVTPGRDGWTLELVQIQAEEPDHVSEPFTLTVREGSRVHRYTGCCWNETRYDYRAEGLRLTRRGFALGRETVADE